MAEQMLRYAVGLANAERIREAVRHALERRGGLHGGEGGEAGLFKFGEQDFLFLGGNRLLGKAEGPTVDAEGFHGYAQGGADTLLANPALPPDPSFHYNCTRSGQELEFHSYGVQR